SRGRAWTRPVLRRRDSQSAVGRPRLAPASSRIGPVGLAGITAVHGGPGGLDGGLGGRWPGRKTEAVLRPAGIGRRVQLAEGESLLGLAHRAAGEALRGAGLGVDDLEAILVSTGTPPALSPSLACALAHALGAAEGPGPQALDISAACSGYLYALQ